jgi:hypothetical protein
LAASAASRSLAFDLDRCLRKYKINSPKFAEILNERSKADDAAHAPGVATYNKRLAVWNTPYRT